MKAFWSFYWVFILAYAAIVFSWIYRDMQEMALSKRERQIKHAFKLQEILDGTRQYLPEENIQNIERLIAKWK